MILGPFLSKHKAAGPRIALFLASALAGGVLAPAPAWADARALYYERAFVSAAHERCGLFDAATASALVSAAAQARGAALRAGTQNSDLEATARRALARAAATACASADLAVVAGRVRQAFEGWSRTARMTFAGDSADWTADRTAFSSPTWRLAQRSNMRDAPVTFGYVGGPGVEPGLAAVVSFPGRPRPYAARLVTRDPARAQRPWIVAAGLAPLPPSSALSMRFSTSRQLAPKTLLAPGKTSGLLWRFPASAQDAIAALDPRESFTVEFLFHDDSVAVARFEAGDFVAARAFLAMGER